jgi:hypothetical protein
MKQPLATVLLINVVTNSKYERQQTCIWKQLQKTSTGAKVALTHVINIYKSIQ